MKQIAIIGSGIAGLSTAYLLNQKHQVTVLESADYIGGHTATNQIELDGKSYSIDTGFIVFNDRTYPNFIKLLSQIGVGRLETEMSFSVHNRNTGLEYSGSNLNTLFAARRNLFNVRFWLLIKSILRFNKLCKTAYYNGDIGPDQTLGKFLQIHQFSDYFCENYILPMGAAIWSSSLEEMEQFPMHFFVRFFINHGLLDVQNRPQWYVIPEGSQSYIEPLTRGFKNNIRLNCQIESVLRSSEGIDIHFKDGSQERFDEVVFACHSDQALALLGDATADEQEILGDMPYNANEVILHTDTTLLPKRELAWASWNYQLSSDRNRPASVTYNMNILQRLEAPHTFCVTLNQGEAIAKDKVLKRFVYHHPIFNQRSLAAQQRREQICGHHHTHFVGAYWFNGFHEDGVRSSLSVAERFGVSL